MKWLTALVLALCGVAIVAEGAHAADNTITFDNGQPSSPAAGKVLRTGAYTQAAGYSVVTVTLIATNPKGGPGGQTNCTIDTPTKTWSGTIPGLPAATYNVFARAVFTKPGSPNVTVDTPTSQVTVQ